MTKDTKIALSLMAFVFVSFIGFLVGCYNRGMSDQASKQFLYEKQLCNAEHWRSAHCYEVFKEWLEQ